jgi:hypothetical protein
MSDSSHGASPVHLPPSTPWPLVMALGIALIPGGLVLGPRLGEDGLLSVLSPVTLLGLVLFFLALYKMIREDLDAPAQGPH